MKSRRGWKGTRRKKVVVVAASAGGDGEKANAPAQEGAAVSGESTHFLVNCSFFTSAGFFWLSRRMEVLRMCWMSEK